MSNFHLSRESRDKNSRSILAAFRKIHEMKAKSLFSLGGAVLVLPLLAQGAEAAASLGGIEGVAGFRVLEDGSVEVVLNSGATVVVDASNVESIDGNQVIVSDVAVAELSSLAAGNGAVAGAFGNAGAAVGGLLGLGLAVGGGGGGGGGGSTAISKTLSVIDAPLENALVFYDSNSDGNPDQSEFLGLTNAQGGIDVNYTPVDGGQFIIIPSPVVDASIYGWDSAFAATYAPDAANPIITRDVVTDNSFTQVLLANDTGAGTDQVVSPMSTLVSSGMDEAVLKQVLGLPADTDLNTLNFFEDLSSGDSAAQEAASKVAGFAAAMAKVVDAAVSAASSSGTLTEAELQQITQDAFADAGKVLAVATEGGVSLEDALEAASAVAVAGAISDGVNTDDMAAEIIAAASGGASIDDAITTAVTTQATAGNLTSDQVDGVEEISEAVATASTAIIEIFEDAVIPTGANLDEIEELLKTSLDDATDAADAAINDAVNEQLLGVKLEADSNEATEGQVAILKGNVLANDQNEDGTALDSSTRVDSVNGLDMAEGGTTDGTSSSFVISTRDWATPERTVSIQSIDDAMGLNGVFPEARPFGSPTRGSAVIAEITVGAGDTISYDYIFASYDYIPYNDYSFFAVQDVAGGAGVVLRGETGESTAGPADVRDLKGPGYYVNAGVETSTSKSFSYTFTEAGTYKIAIGVTDVRDTIVDSKISVSNIELTPNGGTAQPVTGFTEHGNVQAEAPTVTALSETLLTGFYGTLIINETGDYIYQVGGPNAEPIAEGEVVTDNFDYTVKLPDGSLATQTLSIKVTGTADAAVDAPTILLDVSPINGADMTAAVFAGSTTNAVGETIVLTISDQDPTTSDIIISDIVVDSDGNFVTTQDVSGLTDGELSVTATVNTTNGSASSTTQAELDRTADVGGDFIIDGPDPTGSTIPFVVTGLDADAVLNIFATDGVTTVTMGVAENGADYVFDVSALNPALNWTAGGTITDNLGNEQTFPAETVYQPQVTVDLPDTINAAEAGSVVVSGTSTVPNGTVSLDIGGIAVTGITTGADGSFTATVDVSSVASDGPLTATASVTFNGATTAPVMDIATLDRTADADTTATMQITAVGQDALITIAGLDADATAVVTLGSGFSTVVNANGSFTVPGENASGGVLTGGLAITDALGNTASVVASEGFSPTINLVIPTVTAANAGAIEITGTTTATVGTMQLTISDADGATVDVMPAAVTVASDGTFTVTGIDLSGQVDGALSVTAVQTYAGLTSSSGDAGVKDTDAGSVTVTPSGFAIVAGEAMVDIDVSDLEPGASVVITMTAPGETPVSVTATANGTVSVPLGGADGGETLSFSYVLTDPVGNTASGTAPDAIAPRVINTDTGEGFQTLQAAIDAAADGETLQMDSGQFNEDVTVDKQLTIKGAQADVSAKFTPEQLDPNMTGTPRGDETEILGTVTIASSDVTLNGLELEDPDEPLTWDESLLAGNPGALDNFTMINTVIEGFKASGSPTFNAGSTATRGSYDGPAVADGWVIENNFIGGVTEGNGGALYLSGLSNASISDNMFWRPAAGHMYVSSLTDTEIDGNFFYHGVHAGGADFDGFGDDFSGNGYGYGYGYGAGGAPADPFFGRNFWIEMKGDNDGVMITSNDGQFNSGGIQLYGQDLAYNFDNITISGNTFRDFVNADPFGVLDSNGKSGFMGAINVAGLDGSQVENLVITGNSITGNADQIYADRDVFSLIVLQGDIVGAVIDDNILTWDTSSTDITNVLQALGAPTSLYDGGLGAIGMSGGLSGVINIEGNTFSETVPSGPGEPGHVVGVFVFASDASGTFQAELTEVGNDFTGWADPNALELVFVNIPDGYTPPAVSLETTDTFVVVADVLVPLRLGDDTANTLTGTGNNELFFGAGGDDAISLGGGQDIVVVDPSDPAASGTDTITGFDTGTFGSGNPDGIFFASLSQGDLRGDGSGSQKIDDVSDVINVNAGLLIFDNSLSAADVTSVLSSLSGDSVLFAASDGANTEIGLWDGSSTSDLAVLNGIANPSDLDSSQFLQFAALPEV